jgi:hypothetical protein
VVYTLTSSIASEGILTKWVGSASRSSTRPRGAFDFSYFGILVIVLERFWRRKLRVACVLCVVERCERRWVSRYRGSLSDFDGVEFPPTPNWVEAQKARQLQNYLVAAAHVLQRPYPAPQVLSLAALSGLGGWRRASCSTLCHKSANLQGLYFCPAVRSWGAAIVPLVAHEIDWRSLRRSWRGSW